MARWQIGACLTLLGCGGGSTKVESAPTANVAAVDAGAPNVAVTPVDAALPGGSWQLALDVRTLLDLAADSQIAALVKLAFGFNPGALADVGLDPTRPILVAQLGLAPSQRAALEQRLKNDGSVEQDVTPEAWEPALRIVVPVVDQARAKTVVASLVAVSGLEPGGTDVFVGASTRVELAPAPGKLVVDVAIGPDPRSRLAERIHAALHDPDPASAPGLAAGEALHLTYNPFDTALVAAYRHLTHGYGPNFSAAARARIADHDRRNARSILQLAGGPGDAVVSRVDIFGRRGASRSLSFEARATPGPKWHAPPPEDWKPSPSVAPDGSEAFLTFSRPLASTWWKLDGDDPATSLTSMGAYESVKGSPLGVMTALPLGVPLFARLLALGFPDAAVERFDRAGFVFSTDGMPIEIGLMNAADAPCVLAAQPRACTAAERLKLGAPAVKYGPASFARLVPVKGTSAVVVMVGETKAALDALAFHATTAGAFEGSFPRTIEGFDIPWMTGAQRLQFDVRLDGDTVDAKLTPTP